MRRTFHFMGILMLVDMVDGFNHGCEVNEECVTELNKFKCTYRGLANIPTDIPQSITCLDLSFNNLDTSFLANFAYFYLLQSIYVRGNSLLELPHSVFTQHINILFLNNNKIEHLPAELFTDLNLKILDLRNNKIEVLPNYQVIQALEILLDNNNIYGSENADWSNVIWRLYRFTCLYCFDCQCLHRDVYKALMSAVNSSHMYKHSADNVSFVAFSCKDGSEIHHSHRTNHCSDTNFLTLVAKDETKDNLKCLCPGDDANTQATNASNSHYSVTSTSRSVIVDKTKNTVKYGINAGPQNTISSASENETEGTVTKSTSYEDSILGDGYYEAVTSILSSNIQYTKESSNTNSIHEAKASIFVDGTQAAATNTLGTNIASRSVLSSTIKIEIVTIGYNVEPRSTVKDRTENGDPNTGKINIDGFVTTISMALCAVIIGSTTVGVFLQTIKRNLHYIRKPIIDSNLHDEIIVKGIDTIFEMEIENFLETRQYINMPPNNHEIREDCLERPIFLETGQCINIPLNKHETQEGCL